MKNNNYGEFCKVFGINPRNVILELFLEMRELDFSIGDIAKETDLNRATAYNTAEELIKEGFLVPTRKVSGAQLYKLNLNKKEVKILINTFDQILNKIMKSYQQKVYA